MALEIREVQSPSDLKVFIKLPAKIHAHHANWVPPIYMDDFGFFNPKKNRSFAFCDHIRLLAYKDGEVAGRIMGLINHRYNEKKGENNARFSYLETYNDQAVAHALLSRVEEWARSRSCERIVGPLGFSDKEPMGYMIEGFENPIPLASVANLAYQVTLLENEGYTTEVNMVGYKLEIPSEIPDIWLRIMPRISEKLESEFTLIEFTSRWKLRKYIRPVLHLTNRAFDQIYGSMPYEEKEMDDFANRFIWLLNPRFIKVIVNLEGEIVAYVVSMSDISNGIRRAKGKLLPFGLFHIIRSARKSKQLTMLLGAIDESYRGRGLDVFMGLKLLDSAHKAGKTVMDSHLVLESNGPMRAEYERLGGVVYKRYRIFQKIL